ncbi:cyclin-like protein [Gorgonomyces haynaldii]|nr:cyclin-like protein [Gorgonomyces haynaldii]
MARPDYMSYQRDLEWDMRQKLLGWLFQVHAQFRLQPETLFITANVLDRFLSLKAVNVSRLQLAGVTSLLIASKFEEIKCPTVRDLVYMVDNAYKPHEITEAERYILTSVHFKLAYPHPLQFVDHIAKQIGLDLTSKYLAQYFSHLSLLDPVFLQYPSHLVGAASVFLATKVVHNIQWTTEHIKQSGYTEQQLLNCVFKLLENCKKATESVEHLVIYKMFASDRYENVSVSMHQFLKRQSY